MEYAAALLRDVLPALMEDADKTPLSGPDKLTRVMASLVQHAMEFEPVGGKLSAEQRAQIVALVKELGPPVIAALCRASKGLYELNKSSKCCGKCIIC
jgi:hypothetical protein